jgi:hypothetical protein
MDDVMFSGTPITKLAAAFRGQPVARPANNGAGQQPLDILLNLPQILFGLCFPP